MRPTFPSRFSAGLAALPLCMLLPALRAGEVFTPLHAARLRAVVSAHVSPSGRYLAYLLAVPRDAGKEPSGPAWQELHLIPPGGASRPYVSGEVSVSAVAWAPDEASIFFLAKRGKDKHASIYSIPIDGGEARRIYSASSDIAAFSLSPDGGRLAFIAPDPPPEKEEKLKEQGFNQEAYEEEHRPVRVQLADLAKPEAPAVPLAVEGFPSEVYWAPRGDRIALVVAPTPLVDDSYMKRRIRVVDAASGAVVGRIESAGKLGPLAWNPSGSRLAFICGEDEHDPAAGRLMTAAADGSDRKQILTDFQGHFLSVAWKDDHAIAYLAAEGVWTSLGEVRHDGTGHAVRLPCGKTVLSGFSLSRDGKTAAVVGESARHPPEVLVLGPHDEEPRRATVSNPWLDGIRLAPQEAITYQARDGLTLDALLVRPLDEEPGKRYPLILYVHGGPEAHESNGWLTSYARPGQSAAARGFAVCYPNYRGSTGRGVAFSKMGQGDPAGKEFDDLVDAVDHLVRIGLVDRARVGITGGSYGGYATAWAATRHTERFAAGVMFVGISDLVSKAGTTDIPTEDFLVHTRSRVHDDWTKFLERSPIYHARNCRTPLLILHGKDDPRVHPSQSLELYRHVKLAGKAPVRLVLYPGEGHGNRKSAARLDYSLRMLQWLEHYLKGPGGAPPPFPIEYPFPGPKGRSARL